MAQIDMATGAEEASESTETEDSQYPWGLRLTLDDDALAKLGITAMPSAGTKMKLSATVLVCSVASYSDKAGEPENTVSLQITAMELSGANSASDAATLLYGDND